MLTLLKRKIQRKRPRALPIDPHGFESIGDILRRMLREAEAQMTPAFSGPLSLTIDRLLDEEQRLNESQDR